MPKVRSERPSSPFINGAAIGDRAAVDIVQEHRRAEQEDEGRADALAALAAIVAMQPPPRRLLVER